MIILIILMLSFEIKTDTLMLMDGVYIFGFNIVIINLFVQLLSAIYRTMKINLLQNFNNVKTKFALVFTLFNNNCRA